jgi:isopentenyl-diphosphate delta-isomerase
MEQVVLVDVNDKEIGVAEKLEAHQKAYLHRAFSVFIFNDKGEMLLQQRAITKYHSGGLWTNACCSHPRPKENTAQAARRRLLEEMGFVTSITPAFEFLYKASFENGLTEHEYDHVFIGNYNGEIVPNEEEVENYCFKSIAGIEQDLKENPQHYTAWFKIAFPKLIHWIQENAYQYARA